MKKKFRLHYQVVDGYEPTDGKRNYLCFSLLQPNTERMRTLAIDEDVYKAILKRCKDEQTREECIDKLHSLIMQRITAGKHEGSIHILA